MCQHGLLVDGTFVGDLARIHRRRILEHDRAGDKRGAARVLSCQRIEHVAESRHDRRMYQAEFGNGGIAGAPASSRQR